MNAIHNNLHIYNQRYHLVIKIDISFRSGTRYTEENVPEGVHTVEFKEVSGWTTPANVTVNVTAGQTATATGRYEEIAQTGAIQVTIEPAEARNAGAQWRRVGTEDWFNSGNTEGNVPEGLYTVEFKEVSGWNKPDDMPVTVTAGHTAEATGTYTETAQTGAIQVTIEPAEARNAGAQWRIGTTGSWFNSGHKESNVATGSHTVEFKPVDGWTKPANVTVNVIAGQTATATGTYQGFTDNEDGTITITDNTTSLMWPKAPHSITGNAVKMNLAMATGFVSLPMLGKTGWRLPTEGELKKLCDDVKDHFTGIKEEYYWLGGAKKLNMEDCQVFEARREEFLWVWPVRSAN